MNALWALTYGDRRALRNEIVALHRRPARAALWLFYVVAIGGFGWLRTHAPLIHGSKAFLLVAMQDVWACGALIAFGALIAQRGSRYAGFFSSPVEALILIRAPLAPPLVAAYLQLRVVVVTLARTFARFAYLILIGIPAHATPLGLAREGLLLAATLIAFGSVPLPCALARGVSRTACIAAGSALILIAALPLVRDGTVALGRGPAAIALAQHLPAWHPGEVFTAAAAGDLAPAGWVLGVAFAACAVFVAVARDAYPELYAISLAHLEWRSRLARRSRSNGAQSPGGARRADSARGTLRGALAIVWLDAIAWSRRASPVTTGFLAMLCLAVGITIALVARTGDPELVAGSIFGALPNLYIGIAATGSVRLAADLRRPLFWLGAEPLVARLSAWAFAPLWRDAVFIALLAAGYGAIARDAPLAAAVVIGGIEIALVTRACGIAIFALVPNALDQRGPAVLLRIALSYVLVTPLAAVALIVGYLARSVLAATLAGVVPALVEGGVLVAFAAWRLAGRVDRLTTA